MGKQDKLFRRRLSELDPRLSLFSAGSTRGERFDLGSKKADTLGPPVGPLNSYLGVFLSTLSSIILAGCSFAGVLTRPPLGSMRFSLLLFRRGAAEPSNRVRLQRAKFRVLQAPRALFSPRAGDPVALSLDQHLGYFSF